MRCTHNPWLGTWFVGAVLLVAAQGPAHAATVIAERGLRVNNVYDDNPALNHNLTPLDMSGILAGKTITAIAVGGIHSLALDADGFVYSWGRNNEGQLGIGRAFWTTTQPLPVKRDGVLAGKKIVAIAAGAYYSLALAADGTVYAWGMNTEGELGNGDNVSSSIPVAVTMNGALAGKKIVAIGAGDFYAVVLASDGTVYGWGSNGYGVLGDGTTVDRHVPVAIRGVLAGKNITAIAAGGGHVLALDDSGTIFSWGYNGDGAVGNGTSDNYVLMPVIVPRTGALTNATITAIAAGSYHSLALAADGTVYAWGWNGTGQTANPDVDTGDVPSPVQLPPHQPITALTGGGTSSLAVTADGVGYMWGYDGWGGSEVGVRALTPPAAGCTIKALAGGWNHNMALLDVAMPPPVVTAITPTAGATGAQVIIDGQNFGHASMVRLYGGGVPFTALSPTQIKATIPPGAVSGSFQVTTLGGTSNNSPRFTVRQVPQVAIFSPASGPAGTEVTITGRYFTGATGVRISNRNATEFNVVSDTVIKATVPANIISGPITVLAPQGASQPTGNFVVALPPVITSFSPASGKVGATIIIRGNNFTGLRELKFFDGAQPVILAASDTQIVAQVPVGAATGPLFARTAQGSATSRGSFFRLPGGLPASLSLVRLSGANFSPPYISLNFTGRLNEASANDPIHYTVYKRGMEIPLIGVGYLSQFNFVHLDLPPDSFKAGDPMTVIWDGLLDDQGKTVPGAAIFH